MNGRKRGNVPRLANGSGNGTFISFRRGPKQPAPISNARSVVTRVVQITKVANANLTIGDVATALGAGGDFAIQNITGFSVPADAAGIFASSIFTVNGSLILTGSSNADDVSVQDSGTADSRASVNFSVPKQRSVIFNRNTSDTTAAAICTTACLWHVRVIQFVA